MFRWFENLIEPFPRPEPETPPNSVFRFCRFYGRAVVWPLTAVALLSTAIAVLEVALIGFVGELVDWLATKSRATLLQEERATLVFYGALVLLVIPALVLLQSLFLHQSLMGNFPMLVRWQAHRYLMRQSLGFFQDEFAGRIATKLMQTSLAVREAVTKLLDIMVYVGVYFLSVVVMLGVADARLTLPLLIWLGVYVAVLWRLLPQLKAVSEQQADARSEMTGRIVDAYANVTTVKLFAHARREIEYARAGMDGFLQTVHPQMRLVTWLYVVVWTLNALMIFSVTALAIHLWLIEAISAGAIAVAITLCLRVNGMSQWIMWEVSGLFENVGIIRDGIQTLSRSIQVEDCDEAAELQVVDGRIEFRGVGFDYGDKGSVLEQLDLMVESGEKVGLVGRSGAGKSTMVNLLLRFYDVDDGAILVDGQDVRNVTQESLRANIGVVTQDTSLLHRSLRENIAYGRPDASEADVITAAQRARAWDFIERSNDSQGRVGLDAHVGERGLKLSGGQRQRIAIARVMLKDAPILVLDEATSALDSEIEIAIQDSLAALMQGKTVIAIAHRLSTIAAMDRLVVLDEGRILEQGSHQTLIERGGLYSDLWSHQSGGFIGTEYSGALAT